MDHIRQLIHKFRVLKADQQARKLSMMKTFLLDFGPKRRTFHSSQQTFNVFTLLQIDTDEVRHSRFLAWLLNANSPHGQGSLFLKTFMNSCRLQLESEVLDSYTVRTEFSGNESRVDVMIYQRGKFIVYLENKIFATEGHLQTDREFRDMRQVAASLDIPEKKQFAVFLTPEGRKPVSGDPSRWTPVAYSRIASDFRELLPVLTSEKVRWILHDWIETVSTFGGSL